jgi:hypothetical protein
MDQDHIDLQQNILSTIATTMLPCCIDGFGFHYVEGACCAPFLYDCLQHQGHKGNTSVTLETCVILGEGTQMDLVLGMGP